MSDKHAIGEKYLKQLNDSFPFFMKEIWRLNPSENLPEPHWIQYDVALWLQDGPPLKGIRGFRGLSKTYITVAYAAWKAYRNPRERIMIVSKSEGHAQGCMKMLRSWIRHIEFLKHLEPKKSDEYRDNLNALDFGCIVPDKDPSVTAFGITGQLPGTRASLIIADDIETLENSMTREARDKLERRAEDFMNIKYPRIPGQLDDATVRAEIVFLGTDWHEEESLYAKLPDKGFEFRAWPICFPTPKEAARIPDLSPSVEKRRIKVKAEYGDPLWPERFDTTEIDAKRRMRLSWAMQNMLMRGLSDEEKRPLRLQDFIVFQSMHRDIAPSQIVWGLTDNYGSTSIETIPSPGTGTDCFHKPILVSEQWKPYQGCVCFVDPAGSGKDETAWAIVAQLYGLLFAKHVRGVQQNAKSPETLEMIAQDCRTHGATTIYIERNFGGDFLIPLLEPVVARYYIKRDAEEKDSAFSNGWTCYVDRDGIHSTGQKESRIIDTLEPIMAQHRLVISESVARDKTLMYQLTRITRERGALEHDDRLEALAGACARFKDCLHQDDEKMDAALKERAQLALVQKYARLKTPTTPNFIRMN